jgi:tRNA threonylcarbamoyladenosine biosynthesis protein TsaB
VTANPNHHPPRIVAIETSGRVGSVALALGPDLLDQAVFSADLNHAVELLPSIHRLTAAHAWPPASIDQFYVSAGPGSFTGLRIGITVARTLAYATGARVVAVPTVDVLAQNALDLPEPPANLAVVLDAKRRQLYAAVFCRAADTYEKIIDACLITPADLLARAPRPLAILGEGVGYHPQALTADRVQILPQDFHRARADMVHRLGWALARQNIFTDPNILIPVYLRRPEAEELWESRRSKPPD